MSEVVIRVENLSKHYILSHQLKKSTNFRELITDGAKSVVKKILKPGSQKAAKHEEFWALNDVSFDINHGDRLGIIGRNGSGKSTMLKILSRIVEPTKGRISIKGRVASLLEVGTGFHAELTGRENIFLNGAILGMGRQEVKRKFDEIVDFSGVEKFLDTPVKRYSSGMYVRLAFAVAAHLEPEILIVDEVLAVGDAEFQEKCIGKMEDVSTKEGRTVLFVSHNMTAVSALCNKGILLDNGKIKKEGSISDCIDQYNQEMLELHLLARQDGTSIIRKADIKKLSVVDEGLCVGYKLFIEMEINPPEDDVGVDVIIRYRTSMLFFAGSAYNKNVEIKKGTRKITLELGPVNLAVGNYSIDINVVKPTQSVFEENLSILNFTIESNVGWNKYNFQLMANWEKCYAILPQKWMIE